MEEKEYKEYIRRLKFCKKFNDKEPIVFSRYINKNYLILFFSINHPKNKILEVTDSFVNAYYNEFLIKLEKTNNSPMAIAKGEKYDTIAFIFNEVEDLGIYCNLQQPKTIKSEKLSLSIKEKNSK